jgi:hypothetical protein
LRARWRDGGEPNRGAVIRQAVHQRFHRLGLRQQAASRLIQVLPGGRRRHASSRPIEQTRAGKPLEHTQASRERWLADAQKAGGPAEAAEINRCAESTQLSQLRHTNQLAHAR